MNVMIGKVEANDEEAIRAINSEMSELLQTMQQGIVDLQPDAIREAASKAREVSAMLVPGAQERVKTAVSVGRAAAATQIVKLGQGAAQQIDLAAVRKIAAMRTAFLDLEDAGDVAAPVVNGRVVDLEPGDYEVDPKADLRSPAEKAWDTRRVKEAAADIAETRCSIDLLHPHPYGAHAYGDSCIPSFAAIHRHYIRSNDHIPLRLDVGPINELIFCVSSGVAGL